jgi:hypothetical protein
MPVLSSSETISQAEFDSYVNDWVEVVTYNNADELAKCFRLDGAKQNINYVYFTALQIAHLVSTVGAQHIKVRFLVIREDDGYPHFALALFAGDDLNGRLSAYYVSQNYWTRSFGDTPQDSPLPQVPPLDVFSSTLLPDALATFWRDNWSPKGDDPLATQDMFNSTYGYLRGYTFEMDDFLKPLVQIKAGIKIEDADPIRINFGLHTYYPANSDELDSTFGLMISYVCPPKDGSVMGKRGHETTLEQYDKAGMGSYNNPQGPIDDTDVFYDLGSPCPPKC